MRPLPWIVLVALLAGCAAAPDPEATPSSATLGATGADGASTPAQPDPNATAEPDVPEPVTLPVSFDGSLPTFVEACDFNVAGMCASLAPGGSFKNHLELPIEGNLTTLRLAVTWTASSPATQELVLLFYGFNDEASELYARVRGPSPLVLEVDDATLLPGGTSMIRVAVPAPYPVEGSYVVAATEQAFTVEGTIVFVPPNP